MQGIQKILVELDAILDTRQGTLLTYYPESINEIMANGEKSKFHTRITDDMGTLDPRIDSVMFKEYYRHRSTDVLKLSIVTNMMHYLRDYIQLLERSTIDSPVVSGYEVNINYYPYNLTEEEQRLIGLAIVNYIRPPTRVSMVNIPYTQMTTNDLKESYSMVVIYNFVEWLKAIGPKIKTMARTPSLVVMVPMLFFDQSTIPADKDNAEMAKLNTNPFKLTTQACAEFFSLVFETINIFSVVDVSASKSTT